MKSLSSQTAKPQRSISEGGRFGTFGGVFTPCTLTILGVIMFLRFGQVVGQAGLWSTLLIIGLANVITFLTTLSLSAIATNTRVKGGGAYFLISRSLGVEFGGAIGIVFFLAQAISVAMYIIGFAEACLGTFPSMGLSMPVLATIVNVVIFACVFVGAGWAIKVQYAILAVLALSLLSFFAGALGVVSVDKLAANLVSAYQPEQNGFTMFALFFPAVTGIMAGANMSGDLKDPGRSIPRGTLAAIAVTALVYLGMAVTLAASASKSELIENNLIVSSVAWSAGLVTAGIFAATLSSALGSMLGAPRILQALAGDEIYAQLQYFAGGSGPSREPRRATILTFGIAQVCILLGSLDLIAPIITMAFMITYGTLNLATFYESITHNPSYRPQFKYCHWSTALAGALGCLVVMFLISWPAALASIMGMFVLHRLIALRKLQTRWGDINSGVVFERTRRNLLRLEQGYYHPKNWRPIVVAIRGTAWNRRHLAVYGHWLTSGHGVLTLAQVIPGDIEDFSERRESHEAILRRFIRESDLEAFPAVVASTDFIAGVEWLIQCHGIGGLRPNTVLLSWPSKSDKMATFGQLLRSVTRLKRSIVAIRCSEEMDDPWRAEDGTIDVWWRGEENGGLMLLLAHLLTQNLVWKDRSIRLLRVIASEDGRESVLAHLNELARKARIQVVTKVVVSEQPIRAIQHESRSAAVVFLGFRLPEDDDKAANCWHMDSIAGPLQTVVFVQSAGEMSLES